MMSNLFMRTLTALIIAPLTLWATWYGGLVFTVFLCVLGIGIFSEWLSLCRSYYSTLSFWVSCVCYAIFIISLFWIPFYSFSLIGIFTLLLAFISKKGYAFVSMGFLYSSLPILVLFMLRGSSEASALTIFFLFSVVWGTDIGAYFVGRLLKGPKLAPVFSPNKTWSGALGGIFFALLTSFLLICFWPHTKNYDLGLAFIVIVLSILSQLGDIIESGIKRHFGVKDSGRLLPGHGGFMDRMDGLIFAAVGFYIVIYLSGYSYAIDSFLMKGLFD